VSLIIVGLGLKFYSHITMETKKIIAQSDKVLYLTNDKAYAEWISSVNPHAESLSSVYFSKVLREDSYIALKEKIFDETKQGKTVCFAIYGHPTFLVQTSLLLAEDAKQNQIKVVIVPAISSLDCLISDLRINPGQGGMQLHEATELLVYQKPIDMSSHLVIFQVGGIGLRGHERCDKPVKKGLSFLLAYLRRFYEDEVIVTFYEASQYPHLKTKIEKLPLKEAEKSEVTPLTTMYIPPVKRLEINEEYACKLKALLTDLNAPSKKSSI
jgi:uncharacterized protein YabN with tetrapyrrole methylase and pyrophosphatase domain